MTPTRPILRYHGGKWMLSKWIISTFPAHRIYVEPYGGAASVLLRKKRSYSEVYNDLDDEVVNLFRVARDQGTLLADRLRLTPFSRKEYRQAFEFTGDPVESAARLVIRSFMGFGSNSINRDIKSGFRSNSDRSGTTPAHDWRHYPRELKRTIGRLRGVVIENKPALELVKQHDSPHTLFYIDPPYVHKTRSAVMHGPHGYKHEMSNRQHIELALHLRAVEGMVIVSGYHSSLYDKLYKGWEIEERKSLADGARPRLEVLYFNPAASRSRIVQRTMF